MGIDRLNRVLLALVGLLLIAVGGVGLARGFGWFGENRRVRALLDPSTERWFHDHGTEARIAGLALAVGLAALALWWLVAQLRRWPTRAASAELSSTEPVPWRALITASALQDSVERRAQRRVDVDEAIARVDASSDEPVVAMRVASVPGADLAELTQGLRHEALRPLVALLASPGCDAHITYGVGKPAPRVVA